MLDLDLSLQAKQFLDSLPHDQARKIVNKIIFLMTNPIPIIRTGGKYQKTDVGEFRIVSFVEEGILKVGMIDHRTK